MLPEWKHLKKKTKKLKLANEPYFQLAEEYLALEEQFYCEGMFDSFYLWFDMLLNPLYCIFRMFMMDFSYMYVMTFVSAYQKWMNWFRFKELEGKIEEWKKIVRSLGGPWISTGNPEYHVFVYAEGMERIRHSQTVPSQKTEKTSPKAVLPVQSQASSPPKSPSVPSAVPSVPSCPSSSPQSAQATNSGTHAG